MENSLNAVTTVAIWIVIFAWVLNLVDKYRQTKKPLTMDDVFDLSRMIVAQLDTLKGSNKSKKTEAVNKLTEAVKNKPGEVAKTVANNPDVAAGAIEMAVNERREVKEGNTDVKNG